MTERPTWLGGGGRGRGKGDAKGDSCNQTSSALTPDGAATTKVLMRQQERYVYVLSWHVPWIDNVLTRPFFSSTRGVISLQSLLNAASRSVFKAGGRKSGA